jgi:hypothetical protein
MSRFVNKKILRANITMYNTGLVDVPQSLKKFLPEVLLMYGDGLGEQKLTV